MDGDASSPRVPKWMSQQAPAEASPRVPKWMSQQAPAAAAPKAQAGGPLYQYPTDPPAPASQLPPLTVHPPGGPVTPDRTATDDKFSRSSLTDAPMAMGRRALQAIQDVPGAIGEAFQAGGEQAYEGVQDTLKDNAGGPAKAAFGVGNQLFSPLTGAVHALVGKPVGEAFGSEDIGNAVENVANLAPIDRLIPHAPRAPGERIEPPPLAETPARPEAVAPPLTVRPEPRVPKWMSPDAAADKAVDQIPVVQPQTREPRMDGVPPAPEVKAPDAVAPKKPTAKTPVASQGYGASKYYEAAAAAAKKSGTPGSWIDDILAEKSKNTAGTILPFDKSKAVAPTPEVAAEAKGKVPSIETAIEKKATKKTKAVDDFYSGVEKTKTKLDMNPEARVKRAKAQGFDTDLTLYHGTGVTDIVRFQIPKGSEPAVFLTNDPKISSGYAKEKGYGANKAANVIPIWARMQNPKIVDWGAEMYSGYKMAKELALAKSEGHDVVIHKNMYDIHSHLPQTQYAFFEPGNLRAKYAAAFDPKVPVGKATMLSSSSTPTVDLLRDRIANAPTPKEVSKARKVAAAVKATFNPTNMDAWSRMAAGDIRAARGLAERRSQIAAKAFEKYKRLANSLNDADQLEVIDYIESRSNGKHTGFSDPEVQGLADEYRNQMETVRSNLEALPDGADRGFVEDYYRHMWKDPAAAREFAAGWGGGKEGSTGFTKERKYPTIADGIFAGLIPDTLDPLETASRYIENANRYIATETIFNEAKAQGTVKMLPPKRVPEGWVPVNGRKSGNDFQQAYAPEGWARIYNNAISQGFNASKDAGELFRAAQRASNTLSGMELGLSGYHAYTTAKQGILSGVATAVDDAVAGHPVRAATKYVKAFASPITMGLKGVKVRDAYLGLTNATPDFGRIAHLLEKAGGRAVGKGRITDEYRFSNQGSYFKAFRQGALRRELRESVANVRQAPITGTAKEVLRMVQRTMDTAASWLFETYIPIMKNGAFYEGMKTYLDNHPYATEAEQIEAARGIWDSVDNRSGEMVQDNMFWNKTLQQSMQLSMLSYSYNIGTMREYGGALMDIANAHKNGWTNRASVIIALPLTLGPIAAAYQFMKTGKPPESVKDLYAPQTGGTTADGKEPERMLVPGDVKELFGLEERGPIKMLGNKMSPLLRTGIEVLTNRDWRDKPIAPDDAGTGEALRDYFEHVLKAFEPFSVQNVLQGKEKGSNLSAPERAMGFRQVPLGIQEPDEEAQYRKASGQRQRADQKRYDAKQAQKYGGTQ